MRRDALIVVILSVVVAVASSFVTRKIHAQRGIQPLTATKLEKFLTGPGVYGKQEESVLAVRGDGSTVEVRHQKAPDGRLVEQKRVSDLLSRRRIVADGLTDSLTTTIIAPPEAAHVTARPEQCAPERPDLQRGSLLGYEVVRVEHEFRHGSGTSRVESWRAPALNCLPLKETSTLTRDDGSQFVTNIREVTSVILGEPDPSLFSIPSGYTERSPAGVFAEYNTRYSALGYKTDASGFAAQKLDEAYQQQRPR